MIVSPSKPKTRGTAGRLPLEQRGLWRALQFAAYLGKSRGEFTRLHKQGEIPNPIKFAGKNHWRVAELMDWMRAGCPLADDWKWEPVIVVALELYRAQLHREVAALQEQLGRLSTLEAAGHTAVPVRRGRA